jgi:hypothetical protein
MEQTPFNALSSEENANMQQYFDSLPKNVQEMIFQSSVSFHSLEDLKRCSAAITGSTGPAHF